MREGYTGWEAHQLHSPASGDFPRDVTKSFQTFDPKLSQTLRIDLGTLSIRRGAETDGWSQIIIEKKPAWGRQMHFVLTSALGAALSLGLEDD